MKLGFIGAGNMASAICGGILSANTTLPSDIILYDKFTEQYSKFNSRLYAADTVVGPEDNVVKRPGAGASHCKEIMVVGIY